MITQLPNKLTVIHRQITNNEIVAVSCLARPGAMTDSDSKLGRTHLMVRLLTKGTKSRSADGIAETLEGMGVRFGASDSYDYVGVAFQCVRGDLSDALDVFSDVIRNPTFPLNELETERQRVYGEIRAREDRTPSATIKRFRQALLSPGPYGRPLEGEPETVARITQADVVSAHQEAFQPNNMVITVVGNLSADEALSLIESRFGSMAAVEAPVAESKKTYAPVGAKQEFTRDVDQGFITMGSITAPLGHEDGPAIDVASAILGQGMSARLFRELRDRRGLAYSVGAFNSQHRGVGYFGVYIGTSPQNITESVAQHGDPLNLFHQPGVSAMDWAASALWAEVELLAKEPVPLDELDRAKAYLIGGYLRGHEANSQQAQYLGYWQLMGLGVEYDERYPQLLREVTARDVMRVANKYLHDPTTVVLRPTG